MLCVFDGLALLHFCLASIAPVKSPFLLAEYYFCSEAVRAAHKAGRLDFIRENIHKAFNVAREKGKIDIACDLQNMLGLVVRKYYHDHPYLGTSHWDFFANI